jgi:hypothetical protein
LFNILFSLDCLSDYGFYLYFVVLFNEAVLNNFSFINDVLF